MTNPPGPVWRVAAASVQGASHERLGLPCQDAHQWGRLGNDLLVAAVADGAGSALLAEVGAAIAVSAAVDAARRHLKPAAALNPANEREWGELLLASLTAARDALENEATVRSLPLRDFACTLSVAIAGSGFVAAIQVGDGAVVAAETDGGMRMVTRPVQGECLNETVFLTSPESLATAQSGVWRGPLAHVAVFSDGLQMTALKMPNAEPHPGFFAPLFRFLEQQGDGDQAHQALAEFLSSPRLRDRTDDDVTLFLATLMH